MKRDRFVIAMIFGAAFLLCLPMIFFNSIPGNDTAGFYSPMIREIGARRWAYGFSAYLPPLFSLVGGLFAALGMPAFAAAKLTSALFFAATVLPLFDLLNRIFNRQVALLGCVLLVLCSPLLEYAGEGILTTGKTFFLVLLVAAVSRFREAAHWRHVVLCGAAAAGLSLIRGEGVIFAGFGLMLMIASLARRGQSRTDRLRQFGRIAAAVLFCLVLISPWLLFEYRQVGWPVTEAKQVLLFNKLFGKGTKPVPSKSPETSRTPPLMQSSGWGSRTVNSIFEEVGKGLFAPFLLLAIPGLIIRLRQRRWSSEETLLMAWIVSHSLFFIGFGLLTGVIQKRYLVAGIPLYLGWAGIGLAALWGWAGTLRWRRHGLLILAALAAVGLVWKGTRDARSPREVEKRADQQALLDTVAWLRTSGRQHVPPDHPYLQNSTAAFHSGRHPIVLSIFPQPAFLADAEWVYIIRRNLAFDWDGLRQTCREKHVNYIVVENAMASLFPDLLGAEFPDDFVVLDQHRVDTDRPYRIIGFTPNLSLPEVTAD